MELSKLCSIFQIIKIEKIFLNLDNILAKQQHQQQENFDQNKIIHGAGMIFSSKFGQNKIFFSSLKESLIFCLIFKEKISFL